MIALHSSLATSRSVPSRRVNLFYRIVEGIGVRSPQLVACLNQPSPPTIVCLEGLQCLPSNTFGYQWAMFLNREQLRPQTNGSRRQQLYTGIYLLTGYQTDLIGTAEVHAFLVGAKGDVMDCVQCFTLLITLYQEGRTTSQSLLTLKNMTKRLYQAYQRGKKSCFDPNTWQPECLWDLPTEYVQHWFRISS